ncbi:jg17463 [Pararge aegeria aegeria]|uniref:Jg17463 protein n=1 Tax=Pararge aegeria aegeria TaxID=348720 RepID=A0A8S4RND7_9NEOP|nr:jg17463 [Pararge aegeria aegeria]
MYICWLEIEIQCIYGLSLLQQLGNGIPKCYPTTLWEPIFYNAAEAAAIVDPPTRGKRRQQLQEVTGKNRAM